MHDSMCPSGKCAKREFVAAMAGVGWGGGRCLTTFCVDHSVDGSAAFLIEVGGKTVLYSGDIRLHGRKTGMATTLLAAMKDKTVDVLLVEGTLLGGSRSKVVNEYELEKEITNHVNSTDEITLDKLQSEPAKHRMIFRASMLATDLGFIRLRCTESCGFTVNCLRCWPIPRYNMSGPPEIKVSAPS